MFRYRNTSPWYTDYDTAREQEYEGGPGLAETGRQRYYRQIREIRDELGISHDEARQRWSDYYAPGGAPIKPVKRVKLALRASTTNKRTCPFCRDAIYHPDEGGPDYVCTSCQAHYHLDCFEDELRGKCATLGCTARRVISRTRVQIRARGRQNDVNPETPVTRTRDDGATVRDLTGTERRDLLRRLEEQRRGLRQEDARWAQEDAEARQAALQREQEARGTEGQRGLPEPQDGLITQFIKLLFDILEDPGFGPPFIVILLLALAALIYAVAT